jgi:hypothetical protein
VLSLSTLSTPTPFNDLKECNKYPWKNQNNEESDEIRMVWNGIILCILIVCLLDFGDEKK